jgi:hypothetical protein
MQRESNAPAAPLPTRVRFGEALSRIAIGLLVFSAGTHLLMHVARDSFLTNEFDVYVFSRLVAFPIVFAFVLALVGLGFAGKRLLPPIAVFTAVLVGFVFLLTVSPYNIGRA